MNVPNVVLVAACLWAIGGVIALRIAWSQQRRSLWWNGFGWSLFVFAAITAWTAEGAWGVAIASLFGMGAAALFLALAAALSPKGTDGKASNRRVGMLPEKGEPLRLLGRLLTFFIVSIAAMIVTVGVAIAARAFFRLMNISDANATIAALFVMPLAWSILAFVLLMQEKRSRQWLTLLLWSLPGMVTFSMKITL